MMLRPLTRRLRPFWDRCVHGGNRPVILKAKHLRLAAALIGAMFMFVIITSHLNRESLKKERQARVNHDIESLQDRTLTKRQVAGIAQAMIMLARPSDAERNRRNLKALMSCQRSVECSGRLTTIVERTLRVRIPVKGTSSSKTIVVAGKPGPVGPRGPQGLPGKDGRNGGAGRNGTDGTVDSALVDGLDNRVADLEGALAAIVNRLGSVQGLLIALCRVIRPAGPC